MEHSATTTDVHAEAHEKQPATAPTTEQRLTRIEHAVGEVNARLEHAGLEKPIAENDKRYATTNRVLVSSLFALGLWKLCGLVSYKLGGLIDGPRAWRDAAPDKKGEAMLHFFSTYFTLGAQDPAKRTHILKYSYPILFVGSTIGLVGGAVLGITRGDRIHRPGDLFVHPVESMKKIFGPAPVKTPAAQTMTAAAQPQPQLADERAHEGTVAAAAQRAL